MTFIVCIDVGDLDVRINEFDTVCAAKWYVSMAQTHFKYPLEVKPENEFRTPVHEFVLDNICIRFTV